MDRLILLYSLLQSDETVHEIRFLLAEVQDPNKHSVLVNNMLRVATWIPINNPKVIKELINAGADVNFAEEDGLTPLHAAVIERKHSLIDILIKSGANINVQSCLERTALHFAISNHQYKQQKRYSLSYSFGPDIWTIVKLLDQENLLINIRDIRGDTPLMWAVMHKQIDTVLMLLEKGANPNIRNADFVTPLHIALGDKNPCPEIIYLLLKNQASLNSVNKKGKTPIGMIIQNARKSKASYSMACSCLKVIALYYRIKKPLKRILKTNSQLYYYLKKCCDEVEKMKSDILSSKKTVFDFIVKKVNQSDFDVPIIEIYKYIVKKILAGHYIIYFNLALLYISKSNLIYVLEITLLSKYWDEKSMAKNRKKMMDHKELTDDKTNCAEIPGEKDFKARKVMPDAKDFEEAVDIKDCKVIPNAKDCTKINLTGLLLQIDIRCLSKYLSNLDVLNLIAAFSKVNIDEYSNFAKRSYS